MTVLPYHVESVVNAYNKQNRLKIRPSKFQEVSANERYVDVVALSQKGIDKAEAFRKISHSLVDAILKEKGGK
jgi:hypothetical protein